MRVLVSSSPCISNTSSVTRHESQMEYGSPPASTMPVLPTATADRHGRSSWSGDVERTTVNRVVTRDAHSLATLVRDRRPKRTVTHNGRTGCGFALPTCRNPIWERVPPFCASCHLWNFGGRSGEVHHLREGERFLGYLAKCASCRSSIMNRAGTRRIEGLGEISSSKHMGLAAAQDKQPRLVICCMGVLGGHHSCESMYRCIGVCVSYRLARPMTTRGAGVLPKSWNGAVAPRPSCGRAQHQSFFFINDRLRHEGRGCRRHLATAANRGAAQGARSVLWVMHARRHEPISARE
ncbi:hypothetical protein EJ04DRAFT_295645 [Polyplosphaeria fusca]|uniref:Uncharacterized protein n=1 Tax=Polyplosphaeria fusca TaxID=682080 RepID=A0A9P4QSR4_9PLEO|nr:hypothetical protein EJ04DRAFT_295645 [Polyplosphaeria fusca]